MKAFESGGVLPGMVTDTIIVTLTRRRKKHGIDRD